MPDLSKVPPWAWVIGAIGIGGALYLYKKHKESLEASAETSTATSSEQATELPPEQYPYSYAGEGGGGSGAAGAIGSASEQPFTELFGQILQGQREMSQEQAEQQKSFFQSIIESQRSATEAQHGGSTIAEGAAGGSPSSGTGTVAPPKAQGAPKCPPGYSQNGPVANAHTCYKTVSKKMTGPKGAKVSCQCHQYQDGHNECQHVVNGKCVW